MFMISQVSAWVLTKLVLHCVVRYIVIVIFAASCIHKLFMLVANCAIYCDQFSYFLSCFCPGNLFLCSVSLRNLKQSQPCR
jgi:hypothetical protein